MVNADENKTTFSEYLILAKRERKLSFSLFSSIDT
jgi:hypothetical protein